MYKQVGIVVIAIIAATVIGGILLFAVQRNRVTRLMVPAHPPDESNRVHHPSGFSLVCPENWEVHTWPQDRGIAVSPRTKIPEIGSISVEPLDSFYSFEDSRQIEFQGTPATLSIVKRRAFDDPPYFSYRLQFVRGHRKYLLRYQIAQDRDEVPPEVLPYLDSFRVDAR